MTSKEIKDITIRVATLAPSVQKDSHPLTRLGPIGHAPPSGQTPSQLVQRQPQLIERHVPTP